MEQFGAPPEGQRKLSSNLTASEYRLLADLLVDYIGAEDPGNQQLGNLADHLYRLAVAVDDGTTLKAN